MTENESIASPYRGAMIAHRARLQALEMCVATSLTDEQAVRDICDAELRNGGFTELATALAQIAGQLARTAADRDGVTEADLWGLLLGQAQTALIATAEIDQMTSASNSKEGNNND